MILKYKNLNLRWRLSLLITMVAIYTAMAIAIAVYFLWTDQIRGQVSEHLQQNTELTALAIKKEQLYEQNNLHTWAQLDVMLDIVTDDVDKRIINTLTLLKENYHLSGDLVVINNQNQVIATTNNTEKNILEMKQDVILSGELESTGKIITRVPIQLSIMPKDTTSGYLILTHPWKDIIKQLATPLTEFLIVNANTMFHFHKQHLLQTLTKGDINFNETFWTMQTLEKLHSSKVSLMKLPNNSIYLYGIVNKKEAFKPISSTLRLIGFVALLLLIPILLIAIWSSNRFLKPILDLQKVAGNIASSGDLSISIPIDTHDEIGKLARILNKMTFNLRKSFEENEKSNNELRSLTENLESRVVERTKELSLALDSLKSAQSQLVQSEKMSSLGQLVAGIAHELNNPISSVHVNTPMLKQYVNDLIDIIEFISTNEIVNSSDKLASVRALLNEKLDDIDYDFLKEDITELLNAQEDAAIRIRDIVLSLRTFSRLDEAEVKSIDLNQGIDNTVNILRHETKNRIEIHKDYQLQQPVECFPGEINQVILNILANSAQAIKGRGNIWISTYVINEDIAQICITDDGSGLSPDIIEKIFDPFVTTKPVGVGTGLGLSISYGIIEKHRGKIIAENIAPHGAKFTIEIPIKQDKAV